jgi:hypothetical protein
VPGRGCGSGSTPTGLATSSTKNSRKPPPSGTRTAVIPPRCTGAAAWRRHAQGAHVLGLWGLGS